jgi:tripartite-type tricarboxylate transporter receptor subunit TctC
MTEDDLRAAYAAKHDPAVAAAVEATKRAMNTPEARQAAKEAIWREVAEQSAEYQARAAIEAEVARARAEATDAA